MLREYRLTNFKAFGETVTIPIRPLTLIFGANSSGKSSIFQSMLLLKQTLEEEKNPKTALLLKGSLVDLGAYRDFVHRHETERNFEFGARFDPEEAQSHHPVEKISKWAEADDSGLSVQFSYDQKKHATTLVHVGIAPGGERQPIISYFPHNDTEQIMIDADTEFWRCWWNDLKSEVVDYLEYLSSRDDGEVRGFARHRDLHADDGAARDFAQQWDEIAARDFAQQWDRISEQGLDYIKNNIKRFRASYENFLPTRFPLSYVYAEKDIEPPPIPSRFISSELKKEIFYGEPDINPITQPICDIFRSILKDLLYLGPLRSPPEHYYTFSGDTPDYVGQTGENFPSILFKRPDMLEKINSDLERLGVRYSLRLSPLRHEDESLSNIFSLRLTDKNTGIYARLRDVGFGISQVLPVVMQSGLSEKKTLLIEQPEIHLHPAHQAELGDMFIRSALGERRNTFLLETHSEHLMLRILRRIRETTDNELPEGFPPIRPEDVAVLYVQPGEKGAQVIEIPVTEDGDFAEKWPQGFFTERVKELF